MTATTVANVGETLPINSTKLDLRALCIDSCLSDVGNSLVVEIDQVGSSCTVLSSVIEYSLKQPRQPNMDVIHEGLYSMIAYR